MDRRTIIFSVLLVLSVVITSLFWNFSGLSGMASTTYDVKVRRYGAPQILVVFFKEEVAMLDVLILENQIWYNVTLSKGEYLVKIYYANSGLYWKQTTVYVAKDIAFQIAD